MTAFRRKSFVGTCATLALAVSAAAASFIAVGASLPYFHYKRDVTLTAAGRSYFLVVDDPIWQHARPGLADIRIYDGDQEIPYAQLVETGGTELTKQALQILQPGIAGGKTQFLLDMADLAEYNRVELTLGARDFVGHATVFGSNDLHSTDWTNLGTTTIYDLSGEKLGKQTSLQFPISTFKYLRVTIDGRVKPAEVNAASASSTREEAAVWRTIAEGSSGSRSGKDTVFKFEVPRGVPAERVKFEIDPAQSNFTRSVDIKIDAGTPVAFGNLSRIHMVRNGLKIDVEDDTVCVCGALSNFVARVGGATDVGAGAGDDGDLPATSESGGKLATPTANRTLTVIVRNGDDVPLKIRSVKLEQREQRIYFEADANSHPALYYGDAKLEAPVYDYSKLFQKPAAAQEAQLGPEQVNPLYTGRPDERPWSERHPAALWVAIVAAVLILGAIALKSMQSAKPA